jgi:hypothetical protein
MKEKLIKEILRSKLLMGYELSKTSKENLLEQNPVYRSQSSIEDELERDKKEKEQEIANTYPNYCKYPDKTYKMPEACGAILDTGIPGLKAPTSTKEERLEVKEFCNYGQPSKDNDGLAMSLLLPKDAEIIFISENTIITTIKDFVKKYPEYYDNKQDIEWLGENISKIIPINTVSEFTIGNEKWILVLKLNKTKNMAGAYGKWVDALNNQWEILGYRNKENIFWPYIQCLDVRTPRQKWVDDNGWWLQWAGILVTAVAGVFTGGATWILAAEILAEMSIAGFVAYREYEKGNNVEAAVSVVTGLLPWLKAGKAFRGVSKKGWTNISETLTNNSGKYNNFQSADDLKTFYDDLSIDGKNAFNVIQRQDEVSRQLLLGQDFASELAANGEKAFLEKAKEMFKLYPDAKIKIDFIRRLWAKELGLNFGVIGFGMVVEAMWGDILDSKHKELLNGLILSVPPNAQLEILFNLAQINPSRAPEFAARWKQEQNKLKELQEKMKQAGPGGVNYYINTNKEKVNIGMKNLSNEMAEWAINQEALKRSMESIGQNYQDISEDELPSDFLKYDPKKLEQEGYTKLSWEDDTSIYPDENIIFTTDGPWVKPVELKRTPAADSVPKPESLKPPEISNFKIKEPPKIQKLK